MKLSQGAAVAVAYYNAVDQCAEQKKTLKYNRISRS